MLKSLLYTGTLFSLVITIISISRLLVWCDINFSTFVVKFFKQFGEILLGRYPLLDYYCGRNVHILHHLPHLVAPLLREICTFRVNLGADINELMTILLTIVCLI